MEQKSISQNGSSGKGCLTIILLILGIVFLWVTKWMGLAILIVAAVWYFTYSLFPANKKGANSSDASIAYDEICQYCGETQKINKVKIIKIGFFSLFIILFILMIILSIQRAAICFLFAAFLADPFGIIGKLDKYIEEKHRKRASIASICIFTLSGILTISSHYYYATNPPTCKFSSFNDTLVEVSCLRETDDFIWNSIESEIDITNLEFVSENPEIALFEFDRVVFDDHIYYTIEPISNGETFVYVRCKECGAESNKIHVVVNGPKATETTTIQTTTAAITSTTTTTTTTTTITTTTTVETTIPQTDLPTEPPTESEIVYQSPEEYESVGEQDISEYVVILNNSTMCYHLSGSCRAAKRIAVENYEEVVVNSIDDVLSWGYAPCGVCAEG